MPSGPKHYLVTGGTGFLGSNVVRALVERGDRVRVLDNQFRGSLDKLGRDVLDRVELVEGDIRDRDAVRRAVEGVDVVCHMAFINGTRYFYEIPETVLEVGLKGSLHTLEAAIECGVREYVYASSSEVYQTPPSVPTAEDVPASIPDVLNPRYSYGGGKLIGEILAFNYGRKHFDRTVVFRPHNVYGPDMGFEHVVPEFVVRLRHAALAAPGRCLDFPIQGDGSETRAFNYVGDFVRGLLAVLDHGQDRTVYHIGTDEEVSIRELAETVAELMGVAIRLVPSPRRAGGTPRRCPDIGRLRALGYEPRFDLRAGLSQTIPWYVDWADRHRP
jgi:nucleoside-diphosphate-sugar epimerase